MALVRPALRRKRSAATPALAGWREYVNLPALGVGPLIAKLDTGARSAALHAENMAIYDRDGESRIRFDVPDGDGGGVRSCDLRLVHERLVKNTGGRKELRQVVETEIEMGGIVWQAQITLTDRTDMGVPMLLGRATIKEHFLVHPARSFVVSRAVRRERVRRKKPGETP
jgi:hypothetical protein